MFWFRSGSVIDRHSTAENCQNRGRSRWQVGNFEHVKHIRGWANPQLGRRGTAITAVAPYKDRSSISITAVPPLYSRVAQGAYLEVEYIRNVLSVSGTLKYADSGTAWCHSGNIEQFFLEPFLNHPCQPKHYCIVYAYCAATLLIIAFKQNARVCEHLLFL